MTIINRSKDQKVLEHYKEISKKYGKDKNLAMKDPFILDSEYEFIFSQLEQFKQKQVKILDLGCGNGHLLASIHEKFPHFSLTGIEFSPELYALAEDRNLDNTQFIQGDAREFQIQEEKFDIIISKRTLINIHFYPDKTKVFQNIKSHLKEGGTYLMIESYEEQLKNLNNAKKEFGLPEIKVPVYNQYQNCQLDEVLQELGFKQVDHPMGTHYLSSHFYITRVFHNIHRVKGSAYENSHFVNFFTKAIPTGVGEYSPILFKVWQL